MTDSRNSAADRRARSTRPQGHARVIEGEAVVVNRRSMKKSARDKAEAFASSRESRGQPAPPLFPEARPVPVRRGSCDLVFQGPQPVRPSLPGRRFGLTIFGGGRDAWTDPVIAAAVAAFGLVAVPAILLALPQEPVAAPLAHRAVAGLVLSDVSAAVAPRGSGEILSVEGTIHNEADETTRVPALRIALAGEAGIVYSKPVTTTVRELEPGGSVGFQSAVAVPAGTSGDLSIEFADEGRQR